ncbi:TPA: hypothetical protein QDC51_001555 [Burkholderia multivorans]|uniref:hypothetical protein n=1 Tax=Burkholderia multivorans TaxID=87883 RepID=UPI000CFFC15D|nr:hypothetical protein [Burkholderia multivorans]MBU9352400.1 hypothetical protein [Burkholderia multivorans]MBU9395091.1 hypothetical protein [Burkholderia multivorans]MEB2485479.1 hypothetical protein [Burkholderia multivorans]MEB2568441.1 hypothetical protein [Burkholderia multivorans]PRF35880.1 hypothetical protein C6Q11_28965 [Burkholderia multivorans]
MDPRDSRGFFYACRVRRCGAADDSSFVRAYAVVAIVRHDGEARELLHHAPCNVNCDVGGVM